MIGQAQVEENWSAGDYFSLDWNGKNKTNLVEKLFLFSVLIWKTYFRIKFHVTDIYRSVKAMGHMQNKWYLKGVG